MVLARLARLALLVSIVACSSSAPPRPAVSTPVAVSPPVDAAPVAIVEPAAQQFARWLAAFNAGDRAGLVAYHQEHFPYDVAPDIGGIDDEVQFREQTGGFDVKKVDPASTTATYVVFVKERNSDQFARVELQVSASEAHRVTRFDIRAIPTPDEFLTDEQRKARTVDDARRRTVIEGIAKELDAHYVFPDKAKLMTAAVREHLAHGDYDKIVEGEAFADTLTKDLREVSHDLHLGVHFGPSGPGPGGKEPTREERIAWITKINFGFGAIARMDGNIAHVVIDGFPPSEDAEVRTGIAALMSQVADADALIIDLRGNGGGSPDTVALVASYVFDAKPLVHLNSMYSRDTGATTKSFTVKDLAGKRFGKTKPVYVLTSKRTFSGGEEFAYDLQTQRRAKIVGETTGGGAHPVGPHVIDPWFTIMVPWGRAINPITKTNWEGTGVTPDIAVAPEAALEDAHRRALADVRAKARR